MNDYKAYFYIRLVIENSKSIFSEIVIISTNLYALKVSIKDRQGRKLLPGILLREVPVSERC